jgi:hypothetical protein
MRKLEEGSWFLILPDNIDFRDPHTIRKKRESNGAPISTDINASPGYRYQK